MSIKRSGPLAPTYLVLVSQHILSPEELQPLLTHRIEPQYILLV